MIMGCATKYQPHGFTGGYSETHLQENMFRVSFSGNEYSGRNRVADFTLLRSAELSLSNGYEYFVIIDEEKHTTTSSYTTPTTYNTTSNANVYGNSIHGNSTTTSYGGQTYHTSKPSASNTILCFKDKPESGLSYNATFIIQSISKKYKINQEIEANIVVQ